MAFNTHCQCTVQAMTELSDMTTRTRQKSAVGPLRHRGVERLRSTIVTSKDV